MKILFPFSATTRGVTVRVSPAYLPDQSDPKSGRWVWSYHIRIENDGRQAVQLISRHWIITDARGKIEEVKGLGVVGEQPIVEPGRAYDYVSGCPLETASGLMRGSYRMVDSVGESFDVAIPPFSLDSPQAKARPN